MTGMTIVQPAHSAVSWFRCAAGVLAGCLVNLAGVAAAREGVGLWVYWVLMTVSVMAGVAAWRSNRARWFGAGLTVGCVGVFVALLVVALGSIH